ncbi:MAG: efflux RND transporter permease subunit, partial [Acidobacteriota bacterium]
MNTLLSWFARNSVAANLLMGLIFLGGLIGLLEVRKTVFPEFASDLISVSVEYSGASPEEVEEAICVRIEEQVQDLEVVKRVRSVATEGLGVVTIELLPGSQVRAALDDVKARVDTIDTFPEAAERPIVQEVVLRRLVLSVAISGPAEEGTLRRLGEQVRDDIASLPGVTQAELVAVRPYEISIEVSESQLRRYGLTFDQVSAAVRQASIDLPGGSVRTESGEVLLRVEGQAYRGREFEELILLTREDGTRITLGEVATVVDGFADTGQSARFDRQPAVLVQVYRVGEQQVTEVAERVKAYVTNKRPRMPDGIAITVWQDDTRLLSGRLETLISNGFLGLALVLLVLALFLELRLAAWVALGVPVSFLGALWLMPTL